MSTPSHYCRSWPLLATVILALGCGKADQIQSFTVPKEPPRVAPGEVASATGTNPDADATNPTQPAAANDRMIAAIVPHKDQATFFKVVGPTTAVDKIANEFAAFLTSVRIKGEGGEMTWLLRPNWTQEEGTGMRLATILIPAEPKPLELTVTELAWRGTIDDMLNNINRWRGQLQLPPIDAKQLAEETQQIKAGDNTITLVDLKGRFQGGMTPPFAGGAPTKPQQADGSPSNVDQTPLPAGHPPIGPATNDATAAPAVATPSSTPKFKLPATWTELPAEGMRKAAFGVADGDKQALVTVSEFSARVPAMADPLQNVNRWRGEIGLARIDADGLAKVTKSIDVDANKATYMAAIPDTSKPQESQVEQATLAAMVRMGDRMWFFKMKGNRELVAAEEPHFMEFLKSVRFTADRGAPDGN